MSKHYPLHTKIIWKNDIDPLMKHLAIGRNSAQQTAGQPGEILEVPTTNDGSYKISINPGAEFDYWYVAHDKILLVVYIDPDRYIETKVKLEILIREMGYNA